MKTPRASRSRSIFANQSSTWLSHDEYVGVKWRWTCGWANKNVRTACVLWVDRLSAITWISRRFGWLTTRSPRNSTNAALVWRGTVWPRTSPDFVSSAARSDNVPWR